MDFEDDQTHVAPVARVMVTPTIELLRPLGRGGMGHVWVARHHGLHTDVVVKFMADHLADDPEATRRFSREAAAASQVKSPHVVQVFDHGVSADGRLYIAMELLEGTDLAGLLAQRRVLTLDETVAIVSQVARALAKAHERGIVHRDIKPENVFLLDAGGGELFVKVLDFGIAKSMFSTVGRGTATGAMVGTPHYMAPEQIMGARALGPPADLWALGVLAFEMLTGTQPFNGETVGAISVAICSGEPPKPTARNPSLPIGTDAWFARACARDEAMRFGSAPEMSEALRNALFTSAPVARVTPPPEAVGELRSRRSTTNGGITGALATARPTRRPRWLLMGAIAGIVVVGASGGVLAYALSRPEPPHVDEPARTNANSAAPPSEPETEAAEKQEPKALPIEASEPPPAMASATAAPRPKSQTVPQVKPKPSAGAPAPSAMPSPSSVPKKNKNVVIE